jgi:hypothetical protein
MPQVTVQEPWKLFDSSQRLIFLAQNLSHSSDPKFSHNKTALIEAYIS